MNIRTIDPLKIAEKLEAVRNFLIPQIAKEIEDEPRLVEALWFLGWVSIPTNYPGGLGKFASDLVNRYSDEIGPESLLRLRGKSKPLMAEIEQALADMAPAVTERYLDHTFAALVGELIDSDGRPDPDQIEEIASKRSEALKKITFETLHRACIEFAKESLPEALSRIATDPGVTLSGEFIADPRSAQLPASTGNRRADQQQGALQFLGELYSDSAKPPSALLWFFPRLHACLLDFMDKRSEGVRRSIAETSVTREIFHWLTLAQETGKGVMFLGHSRFGKSKAVRAFAEMHPGKARVVECPASGSEGDLLREICRALGIKFSSITPPLHEQRAAIDSVIRSARFLLILDEAQMLYPQNGNRRAAPPRLNYVRRQIMDIGIPTAFICTFQSWRHVEKSFLKISSYSNEQFEGRLLRSPIHLPAELTEAEMIEVARIHLPELKDDYLKLVVTPVRLCKGDHLSYIENIALIARQNAAERGAKVPRLDDLERATNDVLEHSRESHAGGDRDQPPARATSARSTPTKPGRMVTPANERETFGTHNRISGAFDHDPGREAVFDSAAS